MSYDCEHKMRDICSYVGLKQRERGHICKKFFNIFLNICLKMSNYYSHPRDKNELDIWVQLYFLCNCAYILLQSALLTDTHPDFAMGLVERNSFTCSML